jgi:cytochrome c oxidase subunit II
MFMKQSGRSDGLLFVLFFIVGFIACVWYILHRQPSFLPLASEHGKFIDSLFTATLIITGIVFLLTQLALVYFTFKYKGTGKAGEKAHWYPENTKLEVIWTVIPAVIIISLIVVGQVGWGKIFHTDPPEDSFVVEIIGEQFAWNIRYPGEDGVFGRRDPQLITQMNPLGIDFDDPAAADDVVVLNELQLPVDHPVLLRIGSKDVIHSVFLPNFRVKMDAVPGMTTSFQFTPNKEGEFDLVCTELCGLGHYRMRGYVVVRPMDEIFTWLEEQRSM